jgi:hypothetical protein
LLRAPGDRFACLHLDRVEQHFGNLDDVGLPGDDARTILFLFGDVFRFDDDFE